MSEIIANIDPGMPTGYEKLDGIEVTKQKDGSLRYNGIIKLGDGPNTFERKVQIPDLLEMWGMDTPELNTEWERYKSDPDKWIQTKLLEELNGKVSALTETVNQMQQHITDLERRNAELEEELRQLRNNPPIPA